ncbi:hypothetical protein PG985_008462 [Apiospora marii]|uniref:Uncharacterized protein n=1 Tax=Apiospora marii TaxID=335849 RepID=A0ABR1STV0_9PEZI
MLSHFQNKLIVITGAASGIGRATAKLLASQGALLSLADQNKDSLAALRAEIANSLAADASSDRGSGSPIFTAVVDVRSQDACNNWIHDTLAHFEGISIAGAANIAGVTNRPGCTEPIPAHKVDDAEMDFVWDVNVRGVVNSLRAQLPHMQQGTNGRGGASIVNAGSISGLMGLPGYLPYVSSKHAVIGMTRTAAKDEGPRGIRVNAIAPGMINTPLLRAVAESRGSNPSHEMFGSKAGPTPALDRLGDAEEVAEVVAFLLSPKSSYVNGAVIPIDGGLLM